MKLWQTRTENKYFVKILWHLLGECVKVTVLLVCSICIVHHFLIFFSIIDLCYFFLCIKRANRLMNSIMNNIFCLMTCLFSPFFFLQVHQLSLSLFFFFERIFTYLLSTYNVSLHCIHTKSDKYYIHLQKKIVQILQMCTTFTNFYVFTI